MSFTPMSSPSGGSPGTHTFILLPVLVNRQARESNKEPFQVGKECLNQWACGFVAICLMDIEAQWRSVLLMLYSLEVAEPGLESNCLPAGHFSAVPPIE